MNLQREWELLAFGASVDAWFDAGVEPTELYFPVKFYNDGEHTSEQEPRPPSTSPVDGPASSDGADEKGEKKQKRRGGKRRSRRGPGQGAS
jgi:hypothetical protein